MSEAKFTKGPWIAKGDIPSRVYGMMRDDEEILIAATGSVNPHSGANANLIAAAPEMYAFLERLIEPFNNVESVICEVETLLAKARGETV